MWKLAYNFYENKNIDIELFGRGHNPISEDHENNTDGKIDALKEFQYSIVIENHQQNNYFSEKFTDAILSWTMPIYFGCPNINCYFPNDCYYTIDINDKNVIENIQNILNKPIEEKHIKAITKARELILNEYNLGLIRYEDLKVNFQLQKN